MVSPYDLLKNFRKSPKIIDMDSLKSFLAEFFKGYRVKVYLFGSYAKGNFTGQSDIDIAIESQEDIAEMITILRYTLEESNLPQKVDVIYLNEFPEFKRIVEKEGKLWIF